MSAFAVFGTQQKIIMFTDGMAVDNDRNTVATDHKKVFKINNRIGFVACGIWGEPLESDIMGLLEANPPTTTGEAAKSISKAAKRHFTEKMDIHEASRSSFRVYVLGYNPDRSTGIHYIASKEQTGWMPVNQPHGKKFLFGFAQGVDGKDLPLTKEFPRNQRLYRDNYAALQKAFQSSLDYAQSKGGMCGGNLYHEVLTPK